MSAERFQQLSRLARKLTSPALADALDGLGRYGCLDVAIHPANSLRGPLFGRAVTVHWAPARKSEDIKAPGPSTWSEVADFLVPYINDGRGLVYVGGAGPLVRDMALAGGLSCTYFATIGFEGVLVGGAVRDAHIVQALGTPVFATNFTPADTQGAYRVAAVGSFTTLGSTLVSTGDWVFADESGAVVVQDDIIETALSKALAIEEAEARMLTRIRAGEFLPQLVAESEGRI